MAFGDQGQAHASHFVQADSAAGLGQFGKTRNVGEGVQELKIDYGPGYRVYYGIHGDELILILMAGSKRTQTADIKKARAYWIEWKETNT